MDEIETPSDDAATQHEQSAAVRKLLTVASGTAVLQICSYGLGFISTLLLTHFLGRSGYGVYTLATSWATLLALPAILGLNRFLVRGLAVYVDQSEWALARGLLLRANHAVVGASCLVAAVAAAVCVVVGASATRVAMPVAMSLIPLNNLVLLRQGAMQALGHVMNGQVPEYVIRPALFIFLIVAARLAFPHALTGTSAVMLLVGATMVASAIGGAWLVKVLPVDLKSASTHYRTSYWLRAALPMMLVASITQINNQISILLVGGIRGHPAAGVFNLAETGGNITALVLFAAVMPLAPEIARLHARHDIKGMEHTCRRVGQWALFGSLPIACAFAALPRFVLGLFGHGFQGGSTALAILALAQLVNAAVGPAGNVLLMSGHERQGAMSVGVGMVANLAFSAVLIPIFGITGGAIGEATSGIVWNALAWHFVRRSVGINSAAFGPRLARRGPVA